MFQFFFRVTALFLCVVSTLVAAPAMAQVTATFTTGAIAEYENNANQNFNSKSFASLGISQIVLSQTNTRWGGQGNDVAVTMEIRFTDQNKAPYTFTGYLNWQLNDSGAIPVQYFGVLADNPVPDTADGFATYRRSTTSQKTYILVLPSKVVSSGFSGLVTRDNTDGSANLKTAAIFAALSAEFPAPNTAPTFTAPDGSAVTSYTFNYQENVADTTVLGTLSAVDVDGNTLTYSIDPASDPNGWYEINASGQITLTTAGAAAAANDYETGPTAHVLTVTVSDGQGGTTSIQVTLNETNLADETGLVFTNPTATDPVTGAPIYSFSYLENSTDTATLGTVGANLPGAVFTITAGSGYEIDPATGVITLTGISGTAPTTADNNYEQGSPQHTITVTATVTEINPITFLPTIKTTTITVVLNELNVNDSPPTFTSTTTDPGSGNPVYFFDYAEGAKTSTVLGQITATDLDSRNLTFTFANGLNVDPSGYYAIDAVTGEITLTGNGVSSDANVYASGSTAHLLSVVVTDGANTNTIQVTLNETTAVNAAPTFIGAARVNGTPSYGFTYQEGATDTTVLGTVAADDLEGDTLTYSFTGGTVSGGKSIDPSGFYEIDRATGEITLTPLGVRSIANDFEDTGGPGGTALNIHNLQVEVTDGINITTVGVTLTETNVDEITRKLSEIETRLRTGLRTYAAHGLSDMLAFHERLLRDDSGLGLATGSPDGCGGAQPRKDLSGAINANENGSNGNLSYKRRLTDCASRYQFFADAGATFSRMSGHWTSRFFASLRAEARLDRNLTVGLGLLISTASDELMGFDNGSISDKALQASVYARYRLTDALRTGAFAGLGRTWYDFGMVESDGFVMDGKMTGRRHVFGWMLSGDITVGDVVLTTDAIVSRAVEKLGSATLAARYLGEQRSGIDFAVGTVDVTRISVPVTAPITLSGDAEGTGAWSRLLLSPGLLCEDNSADTSALRCGYQLGARLTGSDGGRGRFHAEYSWESVAGLRRSLLGLGYALRLGSREGMELGLEVNRGLSGVVARDNRAMLNLRVAR